MAGVRARGASKKIGTPYLFLQPLKLATLNLVHNLGLGSSLPRNNFYDQYWGGAGLGEYPNKFGTPYLFLQQLKLATSNLVYNLGLGSSLPRNNFSDKNWRGSGLGSIEKFSTPYFFATVEASNFKFGMQLRFGEYVTITTSVQNLVGAEKIVGITYSAPRTLYHVTGTEM